MACLVAYVLSPASAAAAPIGDRTFSPVTAREFRLNILDATDGPTIAEIELLER